MTHMLVPVVWTHFWDMHSGGGQKLDWPHIFIEAAEDDAIRAFSRLFGRNPGNITCGCCGEDYSIYTEETLREASRYVRNAAYLDDGDTRDIRDTRHDKIVLDIAGRNLRWLDPTMQNLYRMAVQKESPKEAAIAIEKMLERGSMTYNLWAPQRFVPIEEFEQTGIGGRGEQCRIVRLAEIHPDAETITR